MKWFYSSFLGRWYLEFLLLWDRLNTKRERLTPGEISQIIREYSLIGEGVKIMKRNINSTISAKNKEEYHKVLTEVSDLASKAENDPNSSKYKAIESLKSKMDFSNKDVKNDTEYAHMIDRRIKDYEDLHTHIAKRNALREARKQKNGK